MFLGVSINNAIYTLNALRPNRRSRYLLVWSFFASWITIELAPLVFVAQVVIATLFARKGALRTAPGKVAMVLTLGTWTGIAVTIRQSYAARHEIRQALRDLAEVDLSEPLPIRWERNVQFARAGGRSLRMDIVRPDVTDVVDEPRPVLVQVHGGGWVLGFKDRQGQLLMRQMASRGWVCCNVDYRLSPMATFPDHLVDVKRAIAWIRDNADELGVDPEFIAVTGGSAGGHLTALVALTANQPRFQPGFEFGRQFDRQHRVPPGQRPGGVRAGMARPRRPCAGNRADYIPVRALRAEGGGSTTPPAQRLPEVTVQASAVCAQPRSVSR